ncbi:MAG: ATP-binding protein [Propionibacteriaceae bacterium]|jgi:predicted AAA+ superfamily ATPase|nr:ATP-binding protein [Propionibacteriaceae bacterium]
MDRQAMAAVEAWRTSPARKPLILRGVRQCGKTWLLKEFGHRAFTHTVYLNFEKSQTLAGLFESDLDPHRIIQDLSVLEEGVIEPQTTLVIMDEIQECPRALTSLKYFCEEAPEYAVVAAGSLLGLAVRDASGFPVGKVDFIDLRPLTFREFLAVSGNEVLAGYLGALGPGSRLSAPLLLKADRLLREYVMVGGMPEAVAAWLARHDIGEVDTILQAILDSYALDMAKHAGVVTYPKLAAVWRAIPQQLAKENQKFIFSHVIQGARAKDLEDALEWLVAAGIALKVPRVTRPGTPLAAYADDRYFKLYLVDVGLLRRLAGVEASVFQAQGRGTDHFRGALVENYVLTELLAALPVPPYFWRSGNTAEVDFVVQVGSDVVPVEVKSGENTVSRSLGVYKQQYDPAVTIKLSPKPTVNGHLPLTAAWALAAYVDRAR